MTLKEEVAKIKTLFIDTAPIIYYIESHPHFGPLTKLIIDAFQSGGLNGFSSVITLVEVLPKPIEANQQELASRFSDFLRCGKNLTLVEISADMAEVAGRLRGHYTFLRAMDAIQIGVALKIGVDAFLTNDTNLKQIKEIKVLVLKDYL